MNIQQLLKFNLLKLCHKMHQECDDIDLVTMTDNSVKKDQTPLLRPLKHSIELIYEFVQIWNYEHIWIKMI